MAWPQLALLPIMLSDAGQPSRRPNTNLSPATLLPRVCTPLP